MGYKEHKFQALKNVNVAVLTVSDTRTKENDESGKPIMKKLEENGHKIISYSIIRDEKKLLMDELGKLINNDNDVQVIITNGGTGVSRRDITIDVVENLFDKKIEGFGEIFRYMSYKDIGSPAVMSRAVAGVLKNKIIICLPGSLDAVKLATEKLIAPEIGHMAWEASR